MQIYIENLTFDAIIGILENERVAKQKVIVNAKIKYNYKKNDFINYAEVADMIKVTVISKKFKLIEDALETLIQEIKIKFPQCKQIELKISKPNILQECKVAVKIKKNFKKN